MRMKKPLNHTKGIEKPIFDNKEFDSKSHLYKKLPTGMQYPVFILDVLEKQNKIMVGNDGSIFWIDPSSKTKTKPGKSNRILEMKNLLHL